MTLHTAPHGLSSVVVHAVAAYRGRGKSSSPPSRRCARAGGTRCAPHGGRCGEMCTSRGEMWGDVHEMWGDTAEIWGDVYLTGGDVGRCVPHGGRYCGDLGRCVPHGGRYCGDLGRCDLLRPARVVAEDGDGRVRRHADGGEQVAVGEHGAWPQRSKHSVSSPPFPTRSTLVCGPSAPSWGGKKAPGGVRG